MSWFRWSTELDDGTTSDLYVYDSVGDYVQVMVAGRRYKNAADNPNKSPSWKIAESQGYSEYQRLSELHDIWLKENGVWENIPDEYAGKSFAFTDMDALKLFFDKCKADGLRFPEYAYDQLEESREEYKDD